MRLTLAFVLALSLTGAAAAQEAPGTASDTLALATMTPEELFVRASSAELQYVGMLEPARRLLVERHRTSVPYLVTKLDTDDPRERIALENLFVRIGADAVPELLEALRTEARRDDTTRGARLAAYVLARIGDPSAVGPLIEETGHPEWKMRSSVADALGHLGGRESVEALVRLIADPDRSVRTSAAASLDRAAGGDPGTVKEVAARALLEALSDPFHGVRYAASDALGSLGSGIVSPLAEIAGNADPTGRLMAIRALGLVGDDDAVREIERHLDDADWAVRSHAARAAGQWVSLSPGAIRKLERMAMNDPHPLVAGDARSALGMSGDE